MRKTASFLDCKLNHNIQCENTFSLPLVTVNSNCMSLAFLLKLEFLVNVGCLREQQELILKKFAFKDSEKEPVQ